MKSRNTLSETLSIRAGRGRARTQRASRSGQAGFTLVEMLVVIAIIGLIMGLIGPRVLNYLSESKVKTARIQLQSFSSALDLYYLDAGRFPSTAEGLAALVRPVAATARTAYTAHPPIFRSRRRRPPIPTSSRDVRYA